MDITAPYCTDMGLATADIEGLRAAVRTEIENDPAVIDKAGATERQKTAWLSSLDSRLRTSATEGVRESFWTWIRDTYTFVPADRPNWELYETFFFIWYGGMRNGVDSAGFFKDPRLVYQSYYAFIPGRKLGERIAESRRQTLSLWDQKVFAICGYVLSEDEIDYENRLDPFGTVDATASRNYFQEFWEYLLPRLSDRERESLLQAVRRTDVNERLPNLVAPSALNRSVR